MAETVSRFRYAEMRGVTRQGIDDAIRRGVLPLAADGRIDVELADRTWYARHQGRTGDAAALAASEARHTRALLTSTAAKIAITRRRADVMRSRLTERDATQAAVNGLVDQLYAGLAQIVDDAAPEEAEVLRAAVDAIVRDLGDLTGDAMTITRSA